jgi:peptidoglycan hydrolase-like protein with peptidoglycan-binding domain
MENIKTGSKGALVTYLQRKLIALNYPVAVNGDFDQVTNDAVIDYQGKKGLTVDGVVGGNTWVMIYMDTEHPRDAANRIERHNNISQLHPIVRKAAVKVYVQLQSEGLPFRIYEAFRFAERQADLYAQGRTKPGDIVTYAQPWFSYHQYGLAVDFVLFVNNDWSWNDGGDKEKLWARMHELGTQEGLMRLNFETPHLQITGTSSNALREGIYPPGGDKLWYDNFMKALGKQ